MVQVAQKNRYHAVFHYKDETMWPRTMIIVTIEHMVIQILYNLRDMHQQPFKKPNLTINIFYYKRETSDLRIKRNIKFVSCFAAHHALGTENSRGIVMSYLV